MLQKEEENPIMDEIDRIVARVNQLHQEKRKAGFGLIMDRTHVQTMRLQNTFSFMGIVDATGDQGVCSADNLYDAAVFLKNLGDEPRLESFRVHRNHLMCIKEFMNEAQFPFDDYYRFKEGKECDPSSPIVFHNISSVEVGSFLPVLNSRIAQTRFKKKHGFYPDHADWNDEWIDRLLHRHRVTREQRFQFKG